MWCCRLFIHICFFSTWLFNIYSFWIFQNRSTYHRHVLKISPPSESSPKSWECAFIPLTIYGYSNQPHHRVPHHYSLQFGNKDVDGILVRPTPMMTIYPTDGDPANWWALKTKPAISMWLLNHQLKNIGQPIYNLRTRSRQLGVLGWYLRPGGAARATRMWPWADDGLLKEVDCIVNNLFGAENCGGSFITRTGVQSGKLTVHSQDLILQEIGICVRSRSYKHPEIGQIDIVCRYIL